MIRNIYDLAHISQIVSDRGSPVPIIALERRARVGVLEGIPVVIIFVEGWNGVQISELIGFLVTFRYAELTAHPTAGRSSSVRHGTSMVQGSDWRGLRVSQYFRTARSI
jgi:hypothetical protein